MAFVQRGNYTNKLDKGVVIFTVHSDIIFIHS